ncbi:MAG: hypothetical protein QXJ06_00485, partial [Candidatus Aenigmatarchaeota archaeon]
MKSSRFIFVSIISFILFILLFSSLVEAFSFNDVLNTFKRLFAPTGPYEDVTTTRPKVTTRPSSQPTPQQCGHIGESCCPGNVCYQGGCSNGRCVQPQTPQPGPSPTTTPQQCGHIGESCCPGNVCYQGGCSNGRCVQPQTPQPGPSPTTTRPSSQPTP